MYRMNSREWLYSLVNHEKKMPEKYSSEAFSIDRYIAILETLGFPQRVEIPAVQIIGTDGKGSTLAFLETLLVGCGQGVKSFISPHLVRLEERFRREGHSMAGEELEALLDRVREGVDKLNRGATFFEVLNAAFWCWIRQDPPDFILLETGLGGRLDTTTQSLPCLKILTHLERDHIQLLGKTMSLIAREKTQALRPGIPTLIGFQDPHIVADLEGLVAEERTPFRWVERETRHEVLARSLQGWKVRTETPLLGEREFHLSLLGDHQMGNFLSALLALETLLPAQAKEVGDSVVPKWRGRCQVLDGDPDRPVLVDGSHTAVSGQAFRKVLDQVLDPQVPREFSFMSTLDRYPWCYLRGLVRPRDKLFLVDWESPRMWPAKELQSNLKEAGWDGFKTPELRTIDWEEALARRNGTGEGAWIGCGSFYWVGQILKFENQYQEDSSTV
jgi:dihydrofolate synthase/folylpolyglutamate synthase